MKKQLTLLCLAAAAMALAGCGPTSSEGGSSGSSKEESSGKTSESTTSHASDSDSEQPSASTGSEESPDITQTTTDSDPEPEPEPEPLTIYFRDAAWWNEAAASTSITFDGSALTMLTYVRGPLEDGEGGQYNYWSYTFENPAEVTGFRFVRTGTPEGAPGTLEDWGARTVELTLEGRSDGDLYDISGTSASWVGDGGFVEGSWGTYDANDQGTPNPEEPDPEPDPEPGEDPITVYFRDAAWWNEAAASTSITFDGSALTMLTYVRGPLEDGEGGQYNYWSYTFENPAEVTGFRFVRTGTPEGAPGTLEDWGARTVELTLEGRSDGDLYDISGTSASWVGDGGFVEGSWGTYDANDQGTPNPEEPDPEPDPEPGEDPITVYFRDAAWWNEAAASTSITFDGSALTMLTYVRGPLEDGNGGLYNYWSYTFEAPSEVETFRFVRTGTSTDNPGVIQDWGARTVELSLDGVADGAMYDIISTGASWSGDGNFVEGVWGTYDPEDEGKVNAAYLLGSGSFVTGDEWTAAGGVPFVKEGDGAFSALGVDLAEGDVFKVLYLNVWYGYGDMQGIVELADYFAESDGGNVLVTSDVTVDFALSVVDGATTLTIGLSQVA